MSFSARLFSELNRKKFISWSCMFSFFRLVRSPANV